MIPSTRLKSLAAHSNLIGEPAQGGLLAMPARIPCEAAAALFERPLHD